MRGVRAKRLRREVYGDYAVGGRYFRGEDGSIRRDVARATYQFLKGRRRERPEPMTMFYGQQAFNYGV